MRIPIAARAALITAAALAGAATAQAHVTLETAQAAPGALYRAVLRVPHGCAGGGATLRLRVAVPEGVTGVKPMPKAGWALATTPVGLEVREIVWTGELLDAHYDEFVFRARLPQAQPGTVIRFPVVQECADGFARWDEAPGPDGATADLKAPAPALTLVAGAAAPARPVRAGALTIEQPWSRATPAGAKVAGGYLRVTNGGAEPDRLVGGSLPNAGRVEIHEMSVDAAGTMRMRPLPRGLDVKPGETVELRPGGYHVMFVDLREPLREGQTLKGTLTFERAGPVEVEYQVRALGASGGHAHH